MYQVALFRIIKTCSVLVMAALSFLLLILLSSLPFSFGTHFDETEELILVSLIKHLKVKHCILSDTLPVSVDEYEQLSENAMLLVDPSMRRILKLLSRNNVYVMHLLDAFTIMYVFPEDFIIDYGRGVNVRQIATRTVIVWKTDAVTFSARMTIPTFGRPFLCYYHWIIFLDSDISNIARSEYVPYSCLFLVVQKSGPSSYIIYEMYRVKSTTQTITKIYGAWNADSGLKASSSFIYSRRFDMQGQSLTLFTFDNELCKSPVLCQQLHFWEDMSRMMNFSIHLVDQVQLQEEFNITAATLFNEKIESSLMIYPFNWQIHKRNSIAPFWTMKAFMYVRYSRDDHSTFASLFLPFSKELWFCMLFWLFISTASVIIVEYFALKYYAEEEERNFHFIDSLYLSFEVLLNQGGTDPLSRPSCRFVYLALWINVSVIIPLYTGEVVSFLTVETPHRPFDDLDGFLKDSTYKFIAVNQTYMKGYFELKKDKASRFIAKNFFVRPSEMILKLQEGIPKLCDSKKKLTLLSYNNELEEIMPRNMTCQIVKIPTPLFTTFTMIQLSLFSPLTEVFNYNLLIFRSTGVMEKMTRLAFGESLPAETDAFEPIGFLQIFSPLALALIGFAFGLVFFLSEKIADKSNKTG